VETLTKSPLYVALRNRTLSNPRLLAVLDNVPGCVLISVIAPAFVSKEPANLSTRLSLLPTVIISVVSAGLLRHWFN
jgi:uncharacterized membrane protein